MTHSPEFLERVFALRGKEPRSVVAERFGMTPVAVTSLWKRLAKKKGLPPLPNKLGRPTHSQEMRDAVCACYGVISAEKTSQQFGVTKDTVVGIWNRALARGRMKRKFPQRTTDPRDKRDQVLDLIATGVPPGRAAYKLKMKTADVHYMLHVARKAGDVRAINFTQHGKPVESERSAPAVPLLAPEFGITAVTRWVSGAATMSSADASRVPVSVARVSCLEDAS